MLLKFKKINLFFLIALSFLAFSTSYVQASKAFCEEIVVDKNKPIYTKNYTASFINNAITAEIEKGHTPEKAKGIIGEFYARQAFESGEFKFGDSNYISISTMFQNHGCTVQKYFRSKADQGIDDIFIVVRQSDGWINRNFKPIFHESKYDGRCNLKLKNTIALCRQLSVQWLSRNLDKVEKRVSKNAQICFDEHNMFVIQSCPKCEEEFKENIKWLMNMLAEGNFYRTASLLCANGTFKIFEVNG